MQTTRARDSVPTRSGSTLHWPGSLRARLFLAAFVWIALAIPIGGVALALSFRAVVAQDFDDRLQSLLLNLIGSVETTPEGDIIVARPLGDARFQEIYSGWYWLVVPEGEPPLRSRSLWDLPFSTTPLDISATPRLRTVVDASGAEVRVAEQSVLLSSSARKVTFAVTGNLEQLKRAVRDFNQLLSFSLSALGAGLIIAIVTQVYFGLRPLQRVAREVERIRTGQQSNLSSTGLTEIDLLVDQVNTLIDHDRAQLERSRGNAADLAHSLKTPLAVLRSSFEGEEHAEQRSQLDTVQRLIDRQLARAASAGPRPGAVAPVETVLRSVLEGMRRIHEARRLTFTCECEPGLRFAGDPEDLEEMLGNVLDNACKWTRTRVAVAASSIDSQLIISVDDDGPGMTDPQAAHATVRGQRFDQQIPGSGLGLAIVSDLTDMYRGAVELARNAWGGSRVTLTLPAVDDG